MRHQAITEGRRVFEVCNETTVCEGAARRVKATPQGEARDSGAAGREATERRDARRRSGGANGRGSRRARGLATTAHAESAHTEAQGRRHTEQRRRGTETAGNRDGREASVRPCVALVTTGQRGQQAQPTRLCVRARGHVHGGRGAMSDAAAASRPSLVLK